MKAVVADLHQHPSIFSRLCLVSGFPVMWHSLFLTSALPSVGVPCACQITAATLTTHGVGNGTAHNFYLISFLVVLLRSSPAGTWTKGWQEGLIFFFSANSRHKMLGAYDSKCGANIEWKYLLETQDPQSLVTYPALLYTSTRPRGDVYGP